MDGEDHAYCVRQRTSRTGDRRDDAGAERCFATPEHESLADVDVHTPREAHAAVAECVDA